MSMPKMARLVRETAEYLDRYVEAVSDLANDSSRPDPEGLVGEDFLPFYRQVLRAITELRDLERMIKA